MFPWCQYGNGCFIFSGEFYVLLLYILDDISLFPLHVHCTCPCSIVYAVHMTLPTVNVPKFQNCFRLRFDFMRLSLKILSAMANSVDPVQTAPSGAV